MHIYQKEEVDRVKKEGRERQKHSEFKQKKLSAFI